MKVSFSTRLLGVGLAVAAMGIAAGAARADNITFVNPDQSTNVSVTYFTGDVNGNPTYNTEATSAGYYHCIINNAAINNVAQAAFCTDLNDNIYNGESWTATRTTTAAGLNSLSSYYPGGVSNVNAIDYIAQHFTPPPAAAAAQLAIWDLVEGGHVSHIGSVYAWDSTRFSSDYTDLASVYTIEQAALGAGGPSGSIFEKVDTWDTAHYGRPQDLVYANPNPPKNPKDPIPEPAFFQMSALLTGGFLALRLRKSA